MELVSLFDHVSVTPTTDWRPEVPPSLDGVEHLYLDTETDGLDFHKGSLPIGISIKLPGRPPQYLPWRHAGGNLDEDTVRRWAQCELRHKKITGLAVKTEVHGLRAWGVDLEEQGCTVSDVQHSAALLDDHRTRFSMDALAQEYLGREKVGKELDTHRMKDYHASVVAPRAEADAEITEALDLAMRPLLAAEDLGRVKQLEDDVIFPVCEMERNAVPLNEELLAQWNRESEEEMVGILDQISKEVGFSFTPTKTDDWLKLFHHCKLPVVNFTEHGAPSFTDDILESQPHYLVQAGRRASKIGSLRSKFLVPYAREIHNGHLFYHLHQLRWEKDLGGGSGTVTGRFSSSDFNIQQVPKKSKQITAGEMKYWIRQLFVPSEGLWFSADAEQIEFRLAAHFFNSERLNKAYADDPSVSFHRVVHEMVRKVREISYDHLKNLNFCLLYGGGRNKVSTMLGVPRSQSDQFVNAYYRAFPEIQTMIKRAAYLAEHRGFVKTLTGRRSRFKRLTTLDGQSYDPRYYKALNSVCQGGAADINKQKIVELHRERKYTGYLMRGTVHDETFGQVPDAESARRVCEILNRQSFDLRVPILWKGSTGANWAEC